MSILPPALAAWASRLWKGVVVGGNLPLQEAQLSALQGRQGVLAGCRVAGCSTLM